ncbi:MAG: tetratricopeptide repeat protein [Anaerolineae bacterium]|nr:tetratricopeptide repeat protein [Anaerolineae bacterium]
MSGVKDQVSAFAFKGLRLTILVSLFLLLAGIPCLAQIELSPPEAMLKANQHYEAGQFAEAAVIYEAIVEAGIHNSEVYYNLGNAYFKQGDLGRAILNYRRAQHLAPRDADVAANLNFALAQTVDQLEADKGLTDVVQVFEGWLTLNEVAVLALVLWVLLCYFAVLAILLPRFRYVFGWIMAGLVLFLAVGLISVAGRLYNEWRYPPAVVVAPETQITSGPGDTQQYLLEFTLHAGTEVRLLESRSEWKRITLPGNLQGWATAAAIEEVISW